MLTYSKEAMHLLVALPEPLLRWYDRNKRAMPWRDAHNSYYTWVSEIMLQQTRVEAVRGYFDRFVKELPDPAALAACDTDLLLKLWEGLGYYNRARNLQRAAQILVEQYDGRLPATYEQLLTLPGIGAYTAGAIASISFGIPVPCVDGNVLRVIARLTANDADIAQPAVRKDCQALVAGLIPPDRPGDFNQALMELGATVCLPGGPPQCALCPAATFCRAHQAGQEQSYPLKSPKPVRRVQERTILLLLCDGRVLLTKRSSGGLLADLWEFPGREGWLERDTLTEQLAKDGFAVQRMQTLKPAKHIFSHVEWRMQGYLLEVAAPLELPNSQWVTQEELRQDYAVPSAFRAFQRILEGW